MASPSSTYPRPICLFENLFELGTLSTSTEVPGYPRENLLDWSIHLGSRWRASSATEVSGPEASATTVVSVDLGVGVTMEPTCLAWAGFDASRRSGSQFIKPQWSNNGSTWTDVGINTGQQLTDYPGLLDWDTGDAGAHRYWRVKIFWGPAAWTSDPQLGLLVLGRPLYLTGMPSSLAQSLLAVGLRVEHLDNERGENLGANVEAVTRTFRLQFPAGLARDTFFVPGGGAVGFDANMAPHLRQGRPFFFGWLRPGSVPVLPQYEAWIVRGESWRQPFVGTAARRDLRASLWAYRETA